MQSIFCEYIMYISSTISLILMKKSVSEAYSTCFLLNKCSYSAYIELYLHSSRYMYFYLVNILFVLSLLLFGFVLHTSWFGVFGFGGFFNLIGVKCFM